MPGPYCRPKSVIFNPQSVLSDQIRPNAEVAEQKVGKPIDPQPRGETDRRRQPVGFERQRDNSPNPTRLRSATAWQAKSRLKPKTRPSMPSIRNFQSAIPPIRPDKGKPRGGGARKWRNYPVIRPAFAPLRRGKPNQGEAKFMKPNETQPELVWVGARWLLKSEVERVKAEKEEAERADLAAMQPRQCQPRASGTEKEAGNGGSSGGEASPPWAAQSPECAKPVLSDQIKAEAISADCDTGGCASGEPKAVEPAEAAEQESNEATRRSEQIKPEAKSRSGPCKTDLSPADAGTDPSFGRRPSGGQSPEPAKPVFSAPIKVEATSADGESGGCPPGEPKSVAPADMAERESAEATRRSDPPSLRFGVASQIKAEAQSGAAGMGGKATIPQSPIRNSADPTKSRQTPKWRSKKVAKSSIPHFTDPTK